MRWIYTPHSSLVHCVAYDYIDEKLVVFLHGGHSCYVYLNFNSDTFDEFITAESRGRYYAKYIAHGYQYYRTDEYDQDIHMGPDTRGTVLPDGCDPHEDEDSEEHQYEPSASHVSSREVIDKDSLQGCLAIGSIVLAGLLFKSCS